MAKMVEYKKADVLTAARERVSYVFDNFKRIVVSVSSGKDSTVLYNLALEEAKKRNRKIEVFFLDQEAEYQSSIDMIEKMMRHPLVIPKWFQIPIQLTNATSHKDVFLNAWYEGEEWMRPKSDISIHSIDGSYPARFYKFFDWYEQQCKEPTAFLVGLRSKESLTRFRSVTNNPGFEGVSWSTKTKNPEVFRFYPIYDWTFGDIWRFISENGIEYNHIYDQYFWKYGVNMSNMRVSNLIHEKSFKALTDLQEFEPETYEKLIKRLGGVHCAALYAKDEYVYSADKLPANYKTWGEYRDYLLKTTPIDRKDRFIKRFAGQPQDEATYRDQCKQVLINDWENNMPVRKNPKEQLRNIWWDRL